MNSVKNDIKKLLLSFGSTVIGFGNVPRNTVIPEVNKKFPRVIVFGYPLSISVLDTIRDKPTLVYKHHYKTINWLLDQTAYHCVRLIEGKGNNAIAIPASQIIDWEKQKGHVSHKLLGQEAGIGYIGRSGLLINPQFGARVRYASILTDLDFEADRKIQATCGECQKCIKACPARAITPQGVDFTRCFDKLTEFSKIKGIGQHICGVCVKVCDGRN